MAGRFVAVVKQKINSQLLGGMICRHYMTGSMPIYDSFSLF
jgi:hypothetical protein